MYCLDASNLGQRVRQRRNTTTEGDASTICRAAMQTVLIENFLLHMSNRSSRLGPRRSMTKMLWRPSWPK